MPTRTPSMAARLGLSVAIAASIFIAACSSGGSGSSLPAKSSKPDITKLTTAMLADRSSFPSYADGRWHDAELSGPRSPRDSDTKPPECEAIASGPQATTQGAGQSVKSDAQDTLIKEGIFLTPDPPDLKGLADKCKTYTYSKYTVTVSPLSPPGLPSWAAAVERTESGEHSVLMVGPYRGVTIFIMCQTNKKKLSDEGMNALVKLFNDQVAKIEAA